MSNCKFCDKGVPLVIGKTNDYGVAIQYPRRLIAFQMPVDSEVEV